jgi:hypothetical protein
MQTRHLLGLPLACALGACISHSTGGAPPASGLPPRLASGGYEPQGIVALPSPCGLAVVGNVSELHFRMELAGERVSVRHGPDGDTYLVDGLAAQVTTAIADEIAPTARGKSGIELLRMHAIWEAARRSQPLDGDVEPEVIEILTSEHMPAGLSWWFASVGPEAEASKTDELSSAGYPAAPPVAAVPAPPRPTGVAFMTAAYGPRVLVLSVQGQRGEPKSTLVAKAKAWMATVTTSSDPISPRQVTAELEAAGQTCPGRPNAVFEP